MGTLTEVAGSASAAHSTISPATATKIATVRTPRRITVPGPDQFDNNLTTGDATMVFSATAGNIVSTTDNGDGTYSAIWKAPTSGPAPAPPR